MAKNLDFPTLSQMFLPMVLRWQSGAVLPPSVANGRGCTRIQNKREIRISLTFDCNVRSAVFFSCVLAFTSIFCFSYVSLQYHLLCKLHMHINTCIMWLSMNAVSAVKNHLQLHLEEVTARPTLIVLVVFPPSAILPAQLLLQNQALEIC